MPVNTVDEARVFIEKWFNDRGYNNNATSVSEDLEFQFNGISDSGIGFTIIKPIRLPRVVVVATRIKAIQFHIDKLKLLSGEDLENFLWDLKRGLLFVSPNFRFDNPAIPTTMDFTKEISFDELTEGKLHDAVDQTIRCILFTAWLFNRKLGSPVNNDE